MSFDAGRTPTREVLAGHAPLCTDGAWGTELQKRGAAPGEMTDLWNVTAPDAVSAVAHAYVEAGAQVILTNTFSSNRAALERHGHDRRAAELSLAGARISRHAAGSRAWVFGSVGPTGRLIALKSIDAATIEEVAAEQAEALADGGVDAIVVETQTGLEDARAALSGCLSACDLPVGVTFTFDSGRDGTRTMLGATVAEVHAMAVAEGAAFVGANCGNGIATYVAVAQRFRACGGALPVWIKANAGAPVAAPDGSISYPGAPGDFASFVPALLDEGVTLIGGCCGTAPAHVRCVAAVLRGR